MILETPRQVLLLSYIKCNQKTSIGVCQLVQRNDAKDKGGLVSTLSPPSNLVWSISGQREFGCVVSAEL